MDLDRDAVLGQHVSEPVSALEVERKYDVEADTALPDLGATEEWAVRPAERFALDATYVDTADLALRHARTTLRRRTGGHDEGWHLKRPAGADRQELRLPLQDDLPEQLAALVRDQVGGRPLQPVAHLATDRTVHVLSDAAGVPLAEVADDRVTARRLPGGAPLQWREWEVELLGDDRAVLDRVEAVLLAAGARPSSTGSKVGRVLSTPPGTSAVLPAPAGKQGPTGPRPAPPR
jgi:inorganic triphosphatase YgiF